MTREDFIARATAVYRKDGGMDHDEAEAAAEVLWDVRDHGGHRSPEAEARVDLNSEDHPYAGNDDYYPY